MCWATPLPKNCAAFLRIAVLIAGCLYTGAGPAGAQSAGDATLNARIQQFNDGLAAWVGSKTTQQSPVVMVDHTNVNAATDTWDGLHPNAAGEEKMAANWYSALEPYLR